MLFRSGQVDEVTFSPTRTQATYDFLTVSHDGTKGEVTVTLPLGKYTITEVQAPYGFVLTQQSYTVEFGWDNQKNDIVLAKTIVSHEQDGDKECSYSIVNVKDASDAHKNGQTLVFENARVLPTPEKPGDKVSKIGVGIYKQDREALTYLSGAVYELYTVDDIYSADGTKLLDAGTKLATSSTTNASGFTWFDVDVPIRGEYYIDPAGPRSTSRENSGRYRIVEITAPAGYLLDSTPMEVSFTYEGQQIAWQVVDGTNTNLRTSVDISKQDITNGKELPGAKLEIRDADGNLVEGWTSTKTPHTVRGLELEKAYTLTETRVPDGYTEAESIVFKLVQEGTEQVNEVYVKTDDDWSKMNCSTIVMQDAPVLDIDKTDIAGNLLPGATLSMPGIAGIVLTLAVAVDANVLINERIKEELSNGRSVQQAINEGYAGAFSSIFDANITTLIKVIILYAVGTGAIKGFAITTGIGVATSMFTAIVGTRAIVNLLYGGKRVKKLSI